MRFFLTDDWGRLPTSYASFGEARVTARSFAKHQRRCIKVWQFTSSLVPTVLVDIIGKQFRRLR